MSVARRQRNTPCHTPATTVTTAETTTSSTATTTTTTAVSTTGENNTTTTGETTLSQTGYSDIYKVIPVIALLMTISGMAIIMRKENE